MTSRITDRRGEEVVRLIHLYEELKLNKNAKPCPVCGLPILSEFKYCPFCRTVLVKNAGWVGTPLKDWLPRR